MGVFPGIPDFRIQNHFRPSMINRDRTLSRDITATQIPSGDKAPLSAGTHVMIHQTLGGSYTVQTDFGLFRIDGKDADALGEEVKDSAVKTATLDGGAPDPEAIWAQLRLVFDPEIPVNIVDLGLVYSMDVEKTEATPPEAAPGYRVNVAMTLTAPGCGMGPAIAEDAKSKILLVPGVSDADVRITWDPPWNQQMISEEGKMKLGLI
jgi:probable FeS assembly SUF system protein SufT